MRKSVLVICILLTLLSCKSEKKIIQPEYVLKKWASSIKNLDYELYAQCEAYPKSYKEFLNMYKDYYFEEIRVGSVNKIDEQREKIEEKIEIDGNADEYNKRQLLFDCVAVNRKKHNVQKKITGSVDFIKFIDLPKSKRGWLMFNRTLIETNL